MKHCLLNTLITVVIYRKFNRRVASQNCDCDITCLKCSHLTTWNA